MENLFVKNAKYAEWLNSHNFDNCKLNRKEYGLFLADYILGEKDGFVLNLNSGWGSGKTEFLKRFYSYLLTQKHPVIYIDAWESDFAKDPLTVVTSELLAQLEHFNEGIGTLEDTAVIQKLCGRFIKGSLIGAAGVLSKSLLGDAGIGTSFMQQIINDEPQNFLSKLSSNYHEQVNTIKEIRDALGQLAEVIAQNYDAKLPIIVLVDELDRCRPTYAIEMLEVIKHFFKTDNFVFIVATDTDQLVHSISAVYGANFDAAQYLKRFFDRKASLPEPDLVQYLTLQHSVFNSYTTLDIFPIEPHSSFDEMSKIIISLLAKAYSLKIRDIDQLVSKIQSCLRSIESTGVRQRKRQIICYPALIIGLIEFDSRITYFNSRSNFKLINADDMKDDIMVIEGLPLSNYITECLKSVTLSITNKLNSYGEEHKFNQINSVTSMDYYISHGSKEVIHWANSIKSNISTFGSTDIKYWLWEDYKKIIELAGNID